MLLKASFKQKVQLYPILSAGEDFSDIIRRICQPCFSLCATCLIRVPGLLVTPGDAGLEVVVDYGAPGHEVQEEAHPQGGHQVGRHRGKPGLQRLGGGQRQAGLYVTEMKKIVE